MNKSYQPRAAASLLRRLAALVYDGFLIAGLLICASIIGVIINRGQAIKPGDYAFSIYLIGTVFAYFSYSWVRGGQTVGMRAWHLSIATFHGEPFDYWHAAKRFGYAIPSLLLAGLGLWWVLVDRKRLAWHDRWSGTYLYKRPDE